VLFLNAVIFKRCGTVNVLFFKPWKQERTEQNGLEVGSEISEIPDFI